MEPIKIPYYRYQRILGPYFSVLTLIWGIGMLIFGFLLIFDANDLFGIVFIIADLIALFLISRYYYTLLEITEKHLIFQFFFKKIHIPIGNITKIKRKIFPDYKTLSLMEPIDRESLLLKIDGIFLKYIYITRLERELRVSDSLVERNPKLKIEELWF